MIIKVHQNARYGIAKYQVQKYLYFRWLNFIYYKLLMTANKNVHVSTFKLYIAHLFSKLCVLEWFTCKKLVWKNAIFTFNLVIWKHEWLKPYQSNSIPCPNFYKKRNYNYFQTSKNTKKFKIQKVTPGILRSHCILRCLYLYKDNSLEQGLLYLY